MTSRTLPVWDSLSNLVDAFLKKPEFIKKEEYYRKVYGSHGKPTFGMRITQTGSSIRYTLGMFIGDECYASFFSFSVSPYPACCGLTMFHTFAYDKAYLTEEELHAFLKELQTSHASRFWGGWGNEHLEVVMVSSAHYKDTRVYNDTEVPDDINDQQLKVQYPWIYSYFMKTAKKVSAQSFWNANSNRLLHRLDVLY